MLQKGNSIFELRRILSTFLLPSIRSCSISTNGRILKVMGLESSADDCCCSIVTSNKQILSNIVIKQNNIHEKFGGIHPMYAQESHQENMPIAIERALKEAKITLGDLDGIAFTRGPGMYGSLGVCANSAKALAAATGLPLLGVHHMQAHALTPFLTEENPPDFPFLTLLLSGGHTLLIMAKSVSKFEILATTTDESIGASLDKVCRDLKIPWSLGNGSPGAALSNFASFDLSSPSTTYPNPVFQIPYRNKLAFSYAGLRSALSRILIKEPVDEMIGERKKDLVREFFTAAIGQVEEKVSVALKEWETGEGKNGEGLKLGGLVVSGGVASNDWLRIRLRNKLDSLGYKDLRLIFPPPSLCTDNAAMIAWVGVSRLQRNRVDDLRVMQKAKWSIEECEVEFEEESKHALL